MIVVGPNGAGKTNLLESVHIGSQGFALRTRREARLVRFGEEAARISMSGTQPGPRMFTSQVTVDSTGAKRLVLDGAAVAGSDILRRRFPVLAFTPDRLAVVKGGPLVRRTYLDRTIGRVLPARSDLPADYARALAQRNAALRRVRAGLAGEGGVSPWTEAVAGLGSELDTVRAEVVAKLARGFSDHAEALGLTGAAISYEGSGVTVDRLERCFARDLERGTTGAGPHLRDVSITADSRDLRAYGSQGEQRVAVLALVLAEAAVLAEVRGEAPLLLLDDVLSELDDRRKASLVAGLPMGGQAFITATSLRSLPPESPDPALVIDVTPGRAAAR